MDVHADLDQHCLQKCKGPMLHVAYTCFVVLLTDIVSTDITDWVLHWPDMHQKTSSHKTLQMLLCWTETIGGYQNI